MTAVPAVPAHDSTRGEEHRAGDGGHDHRRWARRIPRPIRLTVGVLLVLAGIAMLVLPGPGLLTIFVGLQVLAVDIPVAARAEHAVLTRIRRATATARARRTG